MKNISRLRVKMCGASERSDFCCQNMMMKLEEIVPFHRK
jgi:hypothetical protein